nr:sce7726 family protein [Bacteroidota bacterium]
MQINTSYSQNQLRDYSSLFSRGEAQSWMRNDFFSINCKIDRYDGHWKNSPDNTYLDYLKYVYSILEKYYQNEYVFKNTFLTEWLIKEIGQTNSKVFNEYRVGNSIADLVIFNGNSKVFEIKTEYDSDSRLELQLENYRKVFNQIFLIIPETKLHLYKKYDCSVGIITFNGNQVQKFILQRKALSNSEIDVDTIMHILHTNEYKAIVKKHYDYLPEMTSFNQFHKCSELIKQIPSQELNKHFIEQMKNRDIENVMSNRYYKEFNQLSLALKFSKAEMKDMIQNLKSPLNA